MQPITSRDETDTTIDLTDLRAQLQQEYDSVKTTATLWVSWFTFFITVNYVGLGWFTTTMVEGTFKDNIPLYLTAGLFISQLILGITASIFWRNWSIRSQRNIDNLTSRLRELTPRTTHVKPVGKTQFALLMSRAYVLGSIAMLCIVVVWAEMALHARRHHGRNPHLDTTVSLPPLP